MKHKQEEEQQSPVATGSVHGYSPVVEYHGHYGAPTDFYASVYNAKH